jgi:small-conductance mechanosensitive channel
MTRRALLVYPLLFATAPVLSVAARNPGQYRAADLLAVVAAVLAGFTLLLVLTALVLRRWEPPERAEEIAAALVMVAVAWFFFYLPLRNTITPVARSSSLSYLYLLVWVLASVAVAAWLGRRPEARRAVVGDEVLGQ